MRTVRAGSYTRAIESMLSQAFDYGATVELRDATELGAVVEAAPDGFGSDKDTFLDDVLFLMPPLDPHEARAALALRDSVDTAWTGPGLVNSRRVKAQASRSGLSRITAHPFYRRMTIRNWNTTAKLHEPMRTSEAPPVVRRGFRQAVMWPVSSPSLPACSRRTRSAPGWDRRR